MANITMSGLGATSPAKRGILGLPVEITREICGHCSHSDLICLALVCRQFHDLAASQLYRNFHIIFPDEDDPKYDSPIDGLAGGLDTFVTSDYDYAKHLRHLSLDTLSAGARAEQAYRPYLYKVSCGKFMNTLLLLTLRRAVALETFKWNIRVEITRPVYKALHGIDSLKHLHLRMQSGCSLWEAPPPLPLNGDVPIASVAVSHPPNNGWTNQGASSTLYSAGSNAPLGNTFTTIPTTTGPLGFGLNLPPQYTTFAPPPAMPPSPFGPHGVVPATPSHKLSKPKGLKRQTILNEPPTIAGFRKLQSLCVLDIDNHEILPEIQACIQNSSSQLRKLKLSFSENLASQARKPQVELDPNESDDDDEFQIVPLNSNYDDGSGPAKVFRAHEQRKAQELVLGHLFHVEPFVARTVNLIQKQKQKTKEKSSESEDPTTRNRQDMFLQAIQNVSQRLSDNTGHLASDVSKQKEILDMITAASKLYIDDVEKESLKSSQDKLNASSSQPEADTASNLEHSQQNTDNGRNGTATKPEPSRAGYKTNLHSRDNKNCADPEDIDVTRPEETLHDDGLDDVSDDSTPRNESSGPTTAFLTPSVTISSNGTLSQANSTTPTVAATKEAADSSDIDAASCDLIVEEYDQPKRSSIAPCSHEEIQHELNIMDAELDDAGETGLKISNEDEQLRGQISAYMRKTRGIALKSLSIHLIPVKASVLGRAIDFRTLTRITLLNVGNQAPIWTLMAKENKLQSLPLCKIFTDNTSTPFIHFAAQLNTIQELFLVERSLKYKPESFAPRTDVTLGQIRRAILKKHMPTMRRLMIRNQKDVDNPWDMDEKTMRLICQCGKRLEELAVTTGMDAIHAFLQYLSGLVNLRALHIISFRVDDTCLSVMHETRQFIVDTVSQHPEMQLEWIAIGDNVRVDRIVRITDSPREEVRKDKGKGNYGDAIVGLSTTAPNSLPILPTDVWNDSSSESDPDDDSTCGHAYLKLHLVADKDRSYDNRGVRIFKKEVAAARL